MEQFKEKNNIAQQQVRLYCETCEKFFSFSKTDMHVYEQILNMHWSPILKHNFIKNEYHYYFCPKCGEWLLSS